MLCIYLSRAIFLALVLNAWCVSASLSSLDGTYRREKDGQKFCSPTLEVSEVQGNLTARTFEMVFSGCRLQVDFTRQPASKYFPKEIGHVPKADLLVWSGNSTCLGPKAAFAAFYCHNEDQNFISESVIREKGRCYLDIGQRPDPSYKICVYASGKPRPQWVTWLIVAISILAVLLVVFAGYWFCIREGSCGYYCFKPKPQTTI